jgi:glycosyltransferase involved in cell wall biosynthesis
MVVVDDGSTDNTSEVARGYEGVRLMRQENKGLPGARNAGLRHSEGEYLVFLDADDRLLPEALEAGLDCFDSYPECAFVAGHCTFIAADGSFLKKAKTPHIGSDIYTTILSRRHFIIPGAVMYRRFVFETVEAFDTSLKSAEDYDLYMRIASRFPVYCHDKVIVEYRRHETNMTRNTGVMLKATIEILRSQRHRVKGNKVYSEALEAGIRKGQREYGVPLVEFVRTRVSKGEWKQALGGTYLLLRYYPRGLMLLLSGRRPTKQPPTKRQPTKGEPTKNGGRSRGQKGQRPGAQVGGERAREAAADGGQGSEEIRRLRRRNRHLAKRVQELERQLNEMDATRSSRS